MDVTLSCEGNQLKAHKVILSACSITFRELLKQNPSQNPVVLLWDMKVQEVSAILDFMYNGEVNVKQENLNDFLAVAEKLKVRGLWEEGSGRRGLLEEGKAKSRPAPADSPPPKRVKLVKESVKSESPIHVTPTELISVNPEVKEESVDPNVDYSDNDSNQPLMIDFPDNSDYYHNSYVESIRKETERRLSTLGGMAGGLGAMKPTMSGHIDSLYDPRSPRERQRTVFSHQQLEGLEAEFARSNFVDMDRIMQLSGRLGLTEKQIKIWFQNRRMKQKRDEKEKKDKNKFGNVVEI